MPVLDYEADIGSDAFQDHQSDGPFQADAPTPENHLDDRADTTYAAESGDGQVTVSPDLLAEPLEEDPPADRHREVPASNPPVPETPVGALGARAIDAALVTEPAARERTPATAAPGPSEAVPADAAATAAQPAAADLQPQARGRDRADAARDTERPGQSTVAEDRGGDEAAAGSGGSDRPPAVGQSGAEDDPENRGPAELAQALGEHGPAVVQALNGERAKVQVLDGLANTANPYARRDKASLKVTTLDDSAIKPRAVHYAQKIVDRARGERRSPLFPLSGEDEQGAYRAHETVEAVLEEAHRAIVDVNTALSEASQPSADAQESGAAAPPTIAPEFLEQQAQRLRAAADTIPSRRLCQSITDAYSQEIGKSADRWSATAGIPLSSQVVSNWIRNRNLPAQEAGREAAQALAGLADKEAEFGARVYEVLKADARVQENQAITGWISTVAAAREGLDTEANRQTVLGGGEAADKLLAADTYLSGQLEAAVQQAKGLGVDLMAYKRPAAALQSIRAKSLAAAIETEAQNRLKPQVAPLEEGVTLAGRVLKGGLRLGKTKIGKEQARELATGLRDQKADASGREALFTTEETGVMVAIDQGVFGEFCQAVARVASGDQTDEALAVVRGQQPEAVRAVEGLQLRPLLEDLQAKLADRGNQGALRAAMTATQRTAIDTALARFLNPEATDQLTEETPEAEAAPATEAQSTDNADELSTAEQAAAEDAEAAAAEGPPANGAPEIEVTGDTIRIGDERFDRIEFPELERFDDLRPMEHLGETVLPDTELTDKTEGRQWDAIDRAIDEIVRQAQERARQAQELARRHDRPIPPIPEADATRIDVLRLIEQVWDGPTRWARGSLSDKRHYMVDGELRADEYIVLVLGKTNRQGELVGEHAVAETPLKNLSAMYVTRYDTPGYRDFHWRDVLTVPRKYARYFGARKLVHREREGEPLNVTMFKKAITLLRCRPGAFRQASINELEAEGSSYEE